MSAMAQARIRHMESAAEVCTVAMADLPNHPELCLDIVRAAERQVLKERQLAERGRPWWRFWPARWSGGRMEVRP